MILNKEHQSLAKDLIQDLCNKLSCKPQDIIYNYVVMFTEIEYFDYVDNEVKEFTETKAMLVSSEYKDIDIKIYSIYVSEHYNKWLAQLKQDKPNSMVLDSFTWFSTIPEIYPELITQEIKSDMRDLKQDFDRQYNSYVREYLI